MKRDTTKQIWKFVLPIEDEFSIDLPDGVLLLCVQMQHDAPHLWAICNTQARKVARTFRWYGTGHPMIKETSTSPREVYVGTV